MLALVELTVGLAGKLDGLVDLFLRRSDGSTTNSNTTSSTSLRVNR